MCQPQQGLAANGTTTGFDVFKQMTGSVEVWHLNSAAVVAVITFIFVQFRSLLRSILWPHVTKAGERLLRASIRRLNRGANEGGESSSGRDNSRDYWRNTADKKVGSDLDAAMDEHDNILELSPPEIPYHGPSYTEGEMLKKSQYFYETMKMRRSVRCFSSKEISLKVVQNLIKTAGTSPSGANLQPWTFCLVQSPKVKRAIREVVEEQEQLNYTRRMGAQWVLDLAHLNVNWNKPYLTEAPFILVIMKHAYQLTEDGQRRPVYYSEQSTAIAVGMLLAAIQNAGLCTVVTTPLNAGGAIREILQRPINEKVTMLLPLGHPAEGVHVPDIRKKTIEEIMRIY